MDRRKFLKLAGLAVVGCATGPLSDLALRANAKPTGTRETGAAKRWAMTVNLRACAGKEGCRDCIEACHRVHNVPDFGNPKDEIKWIWTAPFGKVFGEEDHGFGPEGIAHAPILVLCNHCENPPCVKVCPTKATFRRPEDGIVMMDYHRCIGCRYCMAACPYGARSFNWREPRPYIKNIRTDYPTRTLGVVEKCNFCDERLAQGLLPACVEACKEEGLAFGDLNAEGSEVRKILKSKFALRRKAHLGTEPKVYYIW
jgi:Fe-S-cluster-containing dehydrogenase component